MRPLFKSLVRNERGATAIEYGLIAALMVVAILGAFQTLGDTTNGMWATVTTKVVGATS